jgi:hypothetical protein
MSALELALSIALAISVWLLIRLYRKHLIVRHLFIRSSDWCSRKIDEVASVAADEISDLLGQMAAKSNGAFTAAEAREDIPLLILRANEDWRDQADQLQARLRRNSIRALDSRDLDDLIWSPWIAGIKP